MAAQRNFIPSIEKVDEIIALDKGLILDMVWQTKDESKSPITYMWHSALDLSSGMIIEDLKIRTQWNRPLYEGLETRYSFSMFYMDQHRIFAHDYGPSLSHKNKNGYGQGKPYYDQIITGSHEHIWSDNGYNYAEPIDSEVASSTMKKQWEFFCNQAGIIRNVTFSDPLFEAESGQGMLI